MKTESLQPATPAECKQVLTEYPDLTASGFDTHYRDLHNLKNARLSQEGRPPEQRTPISEGDVRKQIARARAFLRENCYLTKTIRSKHGTSYGLKHEAERWIGKTYSRDAEIPYVSNGAFIAAAYLEGYTIEREGPNALLSLGFTPEYRRLRKQ
jgi:hypothetical protein